jgi:hypothetical protein
VGTGLVALLVSTDREMEDGMWMPCCDKDMIASLLVAGLVLLIVSTGREVQDGILSFCEDAGMTGSLVRPVEL